MIRLLLEMSKTDMESKNFEDQTLLELAAACGQQEVVKLLLEISKVNMNSKNMYR